jgi:hypothetical protein
MPDITKMNEVQVVRPGEFAPEKHWYPKALNATIHPMVSFFLNLDRERIVLRYCHLHPKVKPDILDSILRTSVPNFRWSGADLINVTSAEGMRSMVVIENNSCPSGQKSMPLLDDHKELGGYRVLLERSFFPSLKSRRLPAGCLAVLYDKNPVEALGYASAMAEISGEDVLAVPFHTHNWQEFGQWENGVLKVKSLEGEWVPVRAAFRYVTQKPWDRLLIGSKTYVYNPAVACLAGGRNKMVASKAYDLYNGEIQGSGLSIVTPETIWDVHKEEIPLWVRKMGGQAVIKNPYSNAGQGVWTIVNEAELAAFMELEQEYELFIVQSLIGNYNWSSNTSRGKLYHVGTLPDRKGATYAADVRLMIISTPEGFMPLSVYSRQAPEPLPDFLKSGQSSWKILGTNLSEKLPDGTWVTDTNRLKLMDRKDFNKIGIGLDDLIEGYIQTVLSTIAIDKMAGNLLNAKGKFRRKLFRSLNRDDRLISQILDI